MSDLQFVSDEGGDEGIDGDEGQIVELSATEADVRQRLDKFVADAITDHSRTFLQDLIDSGRVLVNGVPARRSYKIGAEDVVTVSVPSPEPDEILPEPIPLNLVYEDRDVIVLDKPAGLVVHPAPGHARGTLVNALLAHAPEMADNGSNRPGIVHRLDKETSGLMVVAKNDRAKLALVAQWQDRSVEKGYVALVRGVVEPEVATIDAPIDRDPVNRKRMTTIATGRPALTHFRVARRFDGCTLLDVELETGRTHQARVHLAFIGHPIVGDSVYNGAVGPTGGRNALVSRQFLHASRLAFDLPGGERMAFESDLPPDLQHGIELLEQRSGST
jgi:23S rRNA pseudouridine1911/1915/1917 synthase